MTAGIRSAQTVEMASLNLLSSFTLVVVTHAALLSSVSTATLTVLLQLLPFS